MRGGRIIMALCFVGILLATPACGNKGPPSLPQKTHPFRLVNLKGLWEGGSISVGGEIKGPKGPVSPRQAADLITGCKVDIVSYAAEQAPCPGCPIQYKDSFQFGKEVMTEQGFLCKVPAKGKGETYFLRVHLMGPGGSVGPPSDDVQVKAR